MTTKKKTDLKKTDGAERDDDAFERLREENPEALLADGFESAYLGVCRRYGQPPLAAAQIDQRTAFEMACRIRARAQEEQE